MGVDGTENSLRPFRLSRFMLIFSWLAEKSYGLSQSAMANFPNLESMYSFSFAYPLSRGRRRRLRSLFEKSYGAVNALPCNICKTFLLLLATISTILIADEGEA